MITTQTVKSFAYVARRKKVASGMASKMKVDNRRFFTDYSKVMERLCPECPGPFVFNHKRTDEMSVVNGHTVTKLNYPFHCEVEKSIGKNHDAIKIPKEAFAEAKVFLVGTIHLSAISQQEVRDTLQKTQPDVVMVELCDYRMNAAKSGDYEEDLNYLAKWKREKEDGRLSWKIARDKFSLVQWIKLRFLLTQYLFDEEDSLHLMLCKGNEFDLAIDWAERNKSFVFAGDRASEITATRYNNSESFVRQIYDSVQYWLALFNWLVLETDLARSNRLKSLVKSIEKRKEKGELQKIRQKNGPAFVRVFIDERDKWMTFNLHKLLHDWTEAKYTMSYLQRKKFEPVNIVAVVGLAHVEGITSKWRKRIHADEIGQLERINI